MGHGAVLAKEHVLAHLAQLEERSGPGFTPFDPFCLFLDLFEQTGPVTRTTEALRYLFAELHERAILTESWGKRMVESRRFYITRGDDDQL